MIINDYCKFFVVELKPLSKNLYLKLPYDITNLKQEILLWVDSDLLNGELLF